MAAEPLAGIAEIRAHARRALIVADATETAYVDLDRVTAAVGLRKADLYQMDDEVPAKFLAFLKKLPSKVLGLLAIPEKTVYIDESLPNGRRRFTHAHEIGHDVLPWHAGAFFHDDQTTLSASTRDELEREANAFASELLFGAGRFTAVADDYAPGLGVPLDLATEHGTSAAAALRYYAEWSARPVALIALSRYVTHRGDGSRAIRVLQEQSFASASFVHRFGTIDAMFPDGFASTKNGIFHLAAESTRTGVGAMGQVHVAVGDKVVTLDAEVFNNGWLRFVLLTRRSRLQGRRKELVDVSGRPLSRSL